MKQNLTNHITVVLDASYSMDRLKYKVIEVTDELVKFLAKDSQDKNQETRVSIYTFNDTVQCRIWDMDVLRLPSMKELYHIDGNTALIDAACTALDDFELIPEKYGDHGFLLYIITDGEENASMLGKTASNIYFGRLATDTKSKFMHDRLSKLADNRTVVTFVPNDNGARLARDYGFPADNIAIWDATTERGLEQAAKTIQQTASDYTTYRATGMRGTRSIFKLGGNVDAKQVKTNLTPVPSSDYQIVPVVKTPDAFYPREKDIAAQEAYIEELIQKYGENSKFVANNRAKLDQMRKLVVVEIKSFVDYAHPPYRVGMAYYQLFSNGKRGSEKIQGNKAIAVLDKRTSQVYVGSAARQVVGLPDHDVTVKAESNPDFEIFVQSSSVNRQLPIGTKLLLLTK